ncbi:hypothetical protein Naga_100833g4 [Nannochloropsis gaditana]|uniref:Uncharacterized protein n=1 Tax=Nannochloropsis gaditana TaxID=72520 RepID=W7TIF0_9STRA|nr:hypothetical protein Naga_100833g4 [Nannochloropsis gaditana]
MGRTHVGEEGRQGGTPPPGGEQGEGGSGAEVRVSREWCRGSSLEGVVQRFESRGSGAEVRVSREWCRGSSLEGVVQRFESRLRPGAVPG